MLLVGETTISSKDLESLSNWCHQAFLNWLGTFQVEVQDFELKIHDFFNEKNHLKKSPRVGTDDLSSFRFLLSFPKKKGVFSE